MDATLKGEVMAKKGDGKNKNRMSVYVPDDILAEILEMAKHYGVPNSKILLDAWKIAKNCDCPIPEGVVAWVKERGDKIK